VGQWSMMVRSWVGGFCLSLVPLFETACHPMVVLHMHLAHCYPAAGPLSDEAASGRYRRSRAQGGAGPAAASPCDSCRRDRSRSKGGWGVLPCLL
jgi:hypothetical protein